MRVYSLQLYKVLFNILANPRHVNNVGTPIFNTESKSKSLLQPMTDINTHNNLKRFL